MCGSAGVTYCGGIGSFLQSLISARLQLVDMQRASSLQGPPPCSSLSRVAAGSLTPPEPRGPAGAGGGVRAAGGGVRPGDAQRLRPRRRRQGPLPRRRPGAPSPLPPPAAAAAIKGRAKAVPAMARTGSGPQLSSGRRARGGARRCGSAGRKRVPWSRAGGAARTGGAKTAREGGTRDDGRGANRVQPAGWWRRPDVVACAADGRWPRSEDGGRLERRCAQLDPSRAASANQSMLVQLRASPGVWLNWSVASQGPSLDQIEGQRARPGY